MTLTFANLAALVRLTLTQPRAAAAAVMRLPLPMAGRWSALLLMATLSALLMQVLTMVLPPVIGPDGQVLEPVGPLVWAGMVTVGMMITAGLAHSVGRWRGGKGEFADAILLIAWLQFLQLLLVGVQILLVLVLPMLVPVIEIGGVLLFLWLLVNFVAEMHGFRSLGLVFLGVILTFAATVIALSIVMMSLGVGL
ncbi:YIP1 family protein [Tabrizicola sp. TH137]|uniref:Yip1 family protein n=1 Tax=Tabrizicola sp. TH137 TaxID=2067452 RepID=UPI000C7D40E1|nr:Yip1 family protein [Tabrizicola sp. TH137]PLL13259.1 YIP1 family protein [Tabrizicola sp. TH137]